MITNTMKVAVGDMFTALLYLDTEHIGAGGCWPDCRLQAMRTVELQKEQFGKIPHGS